MADLWLFSDLAEARPAAAVQADRQSQYRAQATQRIGTAAITTR